MNCASLTSTLAVLAVLVGAVAQTGIAQDREARAAWAESAARQAQEAQRRQRTARLRWEYDRRRSAAHARMPSTLYASTPVLPSAGDPSCPVLGAADVGRIDRRWPVGPAADRVDRLAPASSWLSGERGLPVVRAGVRNAPQWSPGAAAGEGTHMVERSGWTAAAGAGRASAGVRHVYLFPSASEPLREGFVRVINHSPEAGEVTIHATDGGGWTVDGVTLSIDANETVHFNSGDLENGNAAKGLSGATGSGQGDWRLAFSSGLDIEVLSYVRTADGFLTAMHDVAPAEGNVHRVAIFNPGSNRNQASMLRLVNPGAEAASVTVRGVDDRGVAGAGGVSLSLDAGTAATVTAAQLESGAAGFDGRLGDGSGKWRLLVESDGPVVAMSLLESPTGHLTNLSTVPAAVPDGSHVVPLFPASGNASGREGFLRVVNRSDAAGEVRIEADDETGWNYAPLTLSIGAREAKHFNSGDLEHGNAGKGLTGGTGPGEGDWRLVLTSDVDIDVLAYIRTPDGFLTSMHDVAPHAGDVHRVAVFNPGSNRNQQSLLRLVNPGDRAVQVAVAGIDGNGVAGEGEVGLAVPAGGARTVSAFELESGGAGLDGALGDGAGKWQLTVTADAPVLAMSLLRSPTGHLTNLSTAPGRVGSGSAGEETAEDVFRDAVSSIVQSKCVNCHVEGGASGNTRLVFVRDTDADHLAKNLAVFETFLEEVEEGAALILNKIQGVGHGGGIQVPAGTDGFADMERFLGLLGEDVGPVAITPATLFDGVKLESWRSTLRRAAIVFAGRTPTEEEYAVIRGASGSEFRAAIRNLMQGPEFHEFLIRASNDRLLTDRDDVQGVGVIDPIFGFFVDFNNLNHQKLVANDPQYWHWRNAVDYGLRRAPLELVAHVVENDLPYTDILTVDYIMANPMAAEAYGAETTFEDTFDPHEFSPSDIASYYRICNGHRMEYELDTGARVIDPGPCATDYPHAGLLNTTVFLKRYPTTATNRNRARSRWTYYHFLGLDIEKSAPRTTDPVALADTDNPTMKNANCTVCHQIMDPVAGAFQNYDDVGYYRSGLGGLDSLDGFYKSGSSGEQVVVDGLSEEDQTAAKASGWMSAGEREIGLTAVNEGDRGHTNIHVDYLTVRDDSGAVVVHRELEDLGDGESNWDGVSFEICCETLIVPVEVPSDGTYSVEVGAWLGYQSEDAQGESGTLKISIGGPFYRHGDTWYRDMRPPGFDGDRVPDAESSLRWLAGRIVADERFAEATVKFWWPALMGREVAEPPEEEGEADFGGRLLASNAQAAEMKRLARGFRRGFRGGSPYNLKDLLVEMVLSRWFRAESLSDDDPVRAVALGEAGARRLLTPEELARKTLALTDFGWGRRRPSYPWAGGPIERTDWAAREDYGLLYGGIDSGGIAERARDITPIMAGVAMRHAAAVACPVVMKDFYLVDETDSRLLGGVTTTTTPLSEFSGVREIAASSKTRADTVSVGGELTRGDATVTLAFVNNEDWFEGIDGDRNLRIDRLDVRNAAGQIVATREMEELPSSSVRGCDWITSEDDHLAFYCEGTVDVGIDVPADGRYDIEVTAWADQYGDELARLWLSVGTDTIRSAGARTIKAKLAELHGRLLGERATKALDVDATYDLFVEIWRGARHGAGDFDMRCDWDSDQYYLDGFVDDWWADPEVGEEWDWERHGLQRELVDPYFESIDWSDPDGVARTWTVVLAYLLSDYRYLFL